MIQSALLTRTETEPAGDSDAQVVVRQIEGRLQGSQYFSCRAVSCLHQQGKLILRGRVPTFYAKQIVQSVVRSICRLDEIVDQIEVAAASCPGGDDFRHLPVESR